MNLRLKTNADVELKLTELQTGLQLSTKAAVMRLAIGLSLQMTGDPRYEGEKIKNYNIKKQDGADYQRFTIFGGNDLLYKVLVEQHMRQIVEEEVFFPELINAHLERGIRKLYSDYKYEKSRDKLFELIFREMR